MVNRITALQFYNITSLTATLLRPQNRSLGREWPIKKSWQVAAIAPWFRLRLPSPGSNPKHAFYAFFNLYWNCNEKKNENKQKRGRDWSIFKKNLDRVNKFKWSFSFATMLGRICLKSNEKITWLCCDTFTEHEFNLLHFNSTEKRERNFICFN